MNKLRDRLMALGTSGRCLAAFAAGALMTLALPPAGIVPVLLLSVPAFIWLTQNAISRRAAFMTGWSFGSGYFIFGLYWISIALFIDIAAFWWAVPLAAIAGPVVFALYYGLIPALAWRWRGHSAAYALALVAAWGLIEWVRGHALTGFPWNLVGYSWYRFPPILQMNAAIGIYGVTALTLLWAATPVFMTEYARKFARYLVLSFVALTLCGGLRLYMHPTENTAYTVRIVQPNIPQTLKWVPDAYAQHFQRQLSLTAQKGHAHIVVWPETAVLGDMTGLPVPAQMIAEAVPDGSVVITGNLRGDDDGRYYNSITTINGSGQVVGTYNKHHLVPFGEYIPFRQWLNMTPVAAGISMVGDFTAGHGPETQALPNDIPAVSPLVCYEAIFPGAVVNDSARRPAWLVNATNDAWYGHSAGPYQHFEITRVRAIEEGLPLVRAANTGISAMIDPLGRVIDQLPLGMTGIIDAPLPQALNATPFSRLGNLAFFVMLVLLLIGAEANRPRST